MAADKEPTNKKASTLDDLVKYSAKLVGHDIIKTGDIQDMYTHVSTGVFIIDLATMGGLPENTVATYVGKPGAGKTTLAYKTIAAFQQKYDGSSPNRPKKRCVFINQEKAYNPIWAAANGVNTAELIIITPTNAEQAVDLSAAALENDDVCLVVLDSIPALVGMKELDKSAEDALAPGAVAVHTNRLMRKLSSIISLAYNKGDKKTFIAINQWRAGIGSAPNMPRTMPGGVYARYYSSTEIEIYNKEFLGRDENDIQIVDYNEHSFKIHKVRAGNSIREGEYTMLRNSKNTLPIGTIDDFHTVVTYAQRYDQIGGAGKGWWLQNPVTKEKEVFGSKTEILEKVTAEPELYEALKYKILSLHRKKNGLSEHDWR